MNALYIIGPPGVGKSTALSHFTGSEVGVLVRPKAYAPFCYERLPDDRLYLGRHRPEYPGTDALGFTVLAAAARWAEEATLLPAELVGEGTRLTHPRFLLPLHRRGDLTVVYLTGSDQALDDRCAVRGSNQQTAFRKGAATKAANCAETLSAAGVRVVEIDTSSHGAQKVGTLIEEHLWRRLTNR